MRSCIGVRPTNLALTTSDPRYNSPGRWESLGPPSIHHRYRTYSTFYALLASLWTSLVFLLPTLLIDVFLVDISSTKREKNPAAGESSWPKPKATRVGA